MSSERKTHGLCLSQTGIVCLNFRNLSWKVDVELAPVCPSICRLSPTVIFSGYPYCLLKCSTRIHCPRFIFIPLATGLGPTASRGSTFTTQALLSKRWNENENREMRESPLLSHYLVDETKNIGTSIPTHVSESCTRSFGSLAVDA
jgi:hypothetical protein